MKVLPDTDSPRFPMSRRQFGNLNVTPIEDRVVPAMMGSFTMPLPPMGEFLALASHVSHAPAMPLLINVELERFADRVPVHLTQFPSAENNQTIIEDSAMSAAAVGHLFRGRADIGEDVHRPLEFPEEHTAVYMPQAEQAPTEESAFTAHRVQSESAHDFVDRHLLILKENGQTAQESGPQHTQSGPVGLSDVDSAVESKDKDVPASETPTPVPAGGVSGDPMPTEPEPVETTATPATLVAKAVASFVANPVAGLLPFEAAGFQAATESLLDHLAELKTELPKGLGQPEVLASIATAAVFIGGASYLAFFAPPRRRLAESAPGSTSSLVWRDSQRDGRTE